MILSLVKTDVLKCNGCGVWLGRLPKWYNAELGKGWSCEHCGCTSVVIQDGRPYGPRSSEWLDLEAEFSELVHDFSNSSDTDYLNWLLDTVVIKNKGL